MLLIDGAKYNLWIPENEEQFERMIKEHSKEIFGQDSLYFGIRQKIVSRTGIGSIPDGYLIRFDPLEWYLVEAELSSHSHEHVVMQLNRFMRGIRNFESQREIVEAMYNEIKGNPSMRETIRVKSDSDDPHHFLSNTISQSPRILITIEQEDTDIQEACEDLKVVPRIIVFQTLVKEGGDLKTHAHLFEPLYATILPPTGAGSEARGFLSKCKLCGMTFTIDRSVMHKPSDDPRVVHQKKAHNIDSIRLEDRFETVGAELREYLPHGLSWEKRLEWVDPSTRNLIPQVISRIEKEFPDASHLPKHRWYYVYKGSTRKRDSLFTVLLLTRKNIHIRIRADPRNFKDEKTWTKAYQGWFWYKRGQERDFSISTTDQIPYAMELIRQSYKLAQ